MRTLLSAINVAVATIIGATIILVARIFRRPVAVGSIYERTMRRWAASIVRAAGVKVVVHGEENLPSGGAVCICNHVSWFDVFSVASSLRAASFVAKIELRSIPVFGTAAESAGIVFIDRENRKSAFDAYKLAAVAVQQGKRIVVFPEGTRGDDYRLRSFKKGPFVLAITAEAPIIPTVVYGAIEVMEKGSFWIRGGTVHIHYLDPIPTKGRSYEDRAQLMSETRAEMDTLLEQEYGVSSLAAG
jgi:1-acyl-sn-glycerol-3-phosphate acyltransferase